MKLTTKSKGLDSVSLITQSLAVMTTGITGAYLNADTREEDSSIHNGDVIQFLAGNNKAGRPSASHKGPKRSILPGQADNDKAAAIYVKRLENRLRVMARKRGTISGVKEFRRKRKLSADDKKAADSAAASGLRLAMKSLQSAMVNSIEFGSHAQVTERYAIARERKFGTPHGVVLLASGQLLVNLQGARVRIVRKKSGSPLGSIGF